MIILNIRGRFGKGEIFRFQRLVVYFDDGGVQLVIELNIKKGGIEN